MTNAVYSGHSRELRERLRAARMARGMTLQQCAERIGEILEIAPLSMQTIHSWESFRRHPPINVMAAWARAVGLRLIVDLDTGESERLTISVRPDVAEIARLLESASDEDLHLVRELVRRTVG